MLPDPLHPAVVHFPIAFAFLLPLAAIVSLWWGQATRRERSAWVPVLVLLVFTLVGGLVAKESGEETHERVEKVMPHEYIEAHEEKAEGFLVATWVGLGFGLLGLLGGRWGLTARWFFVITAIVMALQVTWAGKLGGALVYEHGAASAYVPQSVSPQGMDDSAGMDEDGSDLGTQPEGTEDHDH